MMLISGVFFGLSNHLCSICILKCNIYYYLLYECTTNLIRCLMFYFAIVLFIHLFILQFNFISIFEMFYFFQSEYLLGLCEDAKIKPLTRNCKLSVRYYLPLCVHIYRVNQPSLWSKTPDKNLSPKILLKYYILFCKSTTYIVTHFNRHIIESFL